MPVLKNVLGLDVGSHSLKAAEFQQTLRGQEAVQLRALPRDEETPVPELIRQLVRLHRMSTDHVVAAVPGDHISSRRLRFPFSERRKLTQAVPFTVEEDLPFDLEDVVVDWEIVGGDRSNAEVVASVAPRNEVSEMLAGLAEADCQPRTLEAEGLVLGNLCGLFELGGTRLLVDLGHRKTTLCLVAGGRPVASRTVRRGGQDLTRALAADRGVSPDEAERIKCEEGILGEGASGSSARSVAVLEEIAREILRTVGALEDVLLSLGDGGIEEVTIFGGTAQLAGLDAFLTDRTGLPTARLGLPREDRGQGLAAAGPPILFAPAIALALRGTALACTRTNFRQDEFAMRLDLGRFVRDFRRSGWLAAAALALAVLSFGAGAAVDARRASVLEKESAHLYAGAFPGQAASGGEVAALREAVRTANDRAEFLGVYRGNLSALDLLTEISRLVPAALDIALEELTIDGQTIRMRVHARSFEAADRLGEELEKFEPFVGTNIGAIETDRKSGGKRFNVTISLTAPEDRA